MPQPDALLLGRVLLFSFPRQVLRESPRMLSSSMLIVVAWFPCLHGDNGVASTTGTAFIFSYIRTSMDRHINTNNATITRN